LQNPTIAAFSADIDAATRSVKRQILALQGTMAGYNWQNPANLIRKSLIIKPTWRKWQTR
jgi:hypothetical protein